VQYIAGGEMTAQGSTAHANCFIETGDGKAMLIDFNYDYEPLPGKYPVAGIGPMSLLKQTRLNHMGKLAFKWVYWNVLVPGRPMPVARADVDVRQAHRSHPSQVANEGAERHANDDHHRPRCRSRRRGLHDRSTTSGTRTSAPPWPRPSAST